MARLTRLIVIASILLAVAAGLWPLASRPALLASLAATVAGVGVLSRLAPGAATALVFASAYVSYGLVRMIAGPEVASMPFFLAAFAGLALGVGPWTRWLARGAWRVPLAWWATSVALSWVLVAARELNYSLAPSLAAGPVVTTALLQMCLAVWMDRWLSDAEVPLFRDDDLPLRGWRIPLIGSAMATAAAAIYQRWMDPTWLSGEPWIRLGRSVGMMGDANPMGVVTALWAPLALVASAGSAPGAIAGVALAGPLWLAAWVSGARTTLILIAAGVAGLLLMAARTQGARSRTVIVIGATIAVLIGAVVLVAPRASPSSPLARMGALPRSSSGALYELLWRRDGYGLAANAAIAEHPWLGVGVGRFAQVSSPYHQRLTGIAIPPDNAQNLWRQTLAEQGAIGLLPILWLTGLTIANLLRRGASGDQLLMRVLVAGMGASLLVGYPVQDPAVAVTLATMVAAVGRR